jgi:hypothetical protein
MPLGWYIHLEKRNLMNNRGKDIICKELIVPVLDNLMLPEEIAIVHVSGHQNGEEPRS